MLFGAICESAFMQHNEAINHAKWLNSVSQADTQEQNNGVGNIITKFSRYGYFIETPDLFDGATIRVNLGSQLQLYLPSRAETKQIDHISAEPEAYMTENEKAIYSIYVDLMAARSLTSSHPSNFTLIVNDATGKQQSIIQSARYN